MATSIEFDFAIGDKVKIAFNGSKGEVKAVWLDDDGVRKYFVHWVRSDDGISTRWFKAPEIEAVT